MSSSESRDCMNPSHDTARSSRRQEHVKDLRKRDKFCMICRRKEYALTCGVAKKCSAVQNRRIFGRRAIPFGDNDVRHVGCAEKVIDLILASAGGGPTERRGTRSDYMRHCQNSLLLSLVH